MIGLSACDFVIARNYDKKFRRSAHMALVRASFTLRASTMALPKCLHTEDHRKSDPVAHIMKSWSPSGTNFSFPYPNINPRLSNIYFPNFLQRRRPLSRLCPLIILCKCIFESHGASFSNTVGDTPPNIAINLAWHCTRTRLKVSLPS